MHAHEGRIGGDTGRLDFSVCLANLRPGQLRTPPGDWSNGDPKCSSRLLSSLTLLACWRHKAQTRGLVAELKACIDGDPVCKEALEHEQQGFSRPLEVSEQLRYSPSFTSARERAEE